ncbi:hypothetical protein L2E82_01385 [Cichorium intybus]|uniref:Uncharacterized protein n=1 Tax=Cichorium intybus TaxID=13427 RepID=A0ACB9GZW1_CICIN|nr:hypothetical protein L2E82_01385 [Cichorium intybus]
MRFTETTKKPKFSKKGFGNYGVSEWVVHTVPKFSKKGFAQCKRNWPSGANIDDVTLAARQQYIDKNGTKNPFNAHTEAFWRSSQTQTYQLILFTPSEVLSLSLSISLSLSLSLWPLKSIFVSTRFQSSSHFLFAQ